MSIRQKILYSFVVVILLLVVSLVSVFFFHNASIKEYKKVSNNLIVENTLSVSVSTLIELYNAAIIAPGSTERITAYENVKKEVLNALSTLDTAIENEDSRVAFLGVKKIVLGIVDDSDKGLKEVQQGNITVGLAIYNDALYKKAFVAENTTSLILTEIKHLHEIQSTIENKYDEQLSIILLWVTAIVFTTTLYALLFARRITSPIKVLSISSEKVSKGNYSLRIQNELLARKDEVGILARSFNNMLEKLNLKINQVETGNNMIMETKKHLEERNEELERSQLATANLLEDLEEEKDVVEKRVKERTLELEQEKNKLLQVTGNMKGGGILIDKNFKVVFTNEDAFRLLGIPLETENDLIIEKFFEHFAGTPIQQYYKECIEGKTFHIGEIDGHGKVYEIFFHHLRKSAQEGAETVGYFILFFDISDVKLLERSKSELVAVASHQLRTPLTAMRGNVEMLIDESFGTLNKEQHELLDDIDVSTIRLITMVNDMLDITKIERGDLEMTLEEINIKDVIDSVLGDLNVYAKRHEFTINTQGLAEGILISADKVRIRQVFQNLIDNAIKYSSHPGRLDISTSIKDSMVEIAFKDNGIGVPEKEQSKLFDRFYRASNTSKTSSSGSGLGLYIVKSIANQLGGDIRFESVEGEGTTFYVTLPLRDTNNKS